MFDLIINRLNWNQTTGLFMNADKSSGSEWATASHSFHAHHAQESKLASLFFMISSSSFPIIHPTWFEIESSSSLHSHVHHHPWSLHRILWFLNLCLAMIGVCVAVEICFFLIYKYVWIPRLQKLEAYPQPARNYESKRWALFERMLHRMERKCQYCNIPMKPCFRDFIREHFVVLEEGHNPEGEDIVASSSGLPCKQDLDILLAWAFFGNFLENLTEEEKQDMEQMYTLIKKRHNMEPGPVTKQKLGAMQMTLEPLEPSYRPLVVYLFFWFCKAILVTCILGVWGGFRRYRTSTGVTYWYRPAQPHKKRKQSSRCKNDARSSSSSSSEKDGKSSGSSGSSSSSNMPMVFFHGIAPGGIAFYVPMVLWGLLRKDPAKEEEDCPPIFFFENPAISFSLTDRSPVEDEMTAGVWEAVDRHVDKQSQVSLVGHSFGTCQISWMVHSAQRHRIQQVVLIDPVSIMLSEPDVASNFVYCRSRRGREKLHDSVKDNGAGLVMNEIFIEHYLRRKFYWYNSELWLEDIPSTCQVLVCLSEKDAILNAEKIKTQISIYNHDTAIANQEEKKIVDDDNIERRPLVETILWQDAAHGACISNPVVWEQIRQSMQEQQDNVLQLQQQKCPQKEQSRIGKQD